MVRSLEVLFIWEGVVSPRCERSKAAKSLQRFLRCLWLAFRNGVGRGVGMGEEGSQNIHPACVELRRERFLCYHYSTHACFGVLEAARRKRAVLFVVVYGGL